MMEIAQYSKISCCEIEVTQTAIALRWLLQLQLYNVQLHTGKLDQSISGVQCIGVQARKIHATHGTRIKWEDSITSK